MLNNQIKEAKDKKCMSCKCYKFPSQFFNTYGRMLKTCEDCRIRSKKYRKTKQQNKPKQQDKPTEQDKPKEQDKQDYMFSDSDSE